MIAVNALANALPINGKTTGEISDGFDIAFTPAGYVFAIWGLIYLSVTLFTIVQALPSRERSPVIASIRPWYVLNAVANASWILAWHHELFALTLVVMLVILGSLVGIYAKVASISFEDPVSFATVRAPFSLYLAWICIATIANTTVVLWTVGATDVLSDPTYTLLIVAAATGICAAVSLRTADPVFASVFVWAIVGIAFENSAERTLMIGALACAGVCALVAAMSTVAAIRRAGAGRGSS